MPAWKRTTMNGKFIELARKKAFQKKRRTKRNILHMPLSNKINESGKKMRNRKKRHSMKRAYEN